jgi:two-component system phosphate regulon sensor histidine kinase PhoR
LKFFRKIKTRIALSFSLLFLIVAIPAIIDAIYHVNLFFEGMYLEQMRAAGLTVGATFQNVPPENYDSLTTAISNITSASAFLLSKDGQIVAGHYENNLADTAGLLSMPIISSDTNDIKEPIRRRFIQFGRLRYLQMQIDLPGGMKLLQVKSFSTLSMLMVRMREVIIWGSFLALIALIAVAFWVAANITRPLEKLTMLAQDIRSGQLPQKTEIRSPDEVGDLAEALNDIVDDLNIKKERIGQLETIRRDFFANVSQDLKAPLVNIKEMLGALQKDGSLRDKERGKLLEQALSQTQNLERIMHALIEISKIEFGEAMIELHEIQLGNLVSSVGESFRMQARRKNLQFDIDFPRELDGTMILGDEGLLTVALGNLVSNAIDFTDKGHIRIGWRDEGTEVVIRVEDSGRGIPQDQIERIFERLYRTNLQGRREIDRIGLGLAITKHIIDAHGQKLEVQSKLGIGSIFSFTLKKVDMT